MARITVEDCLTKETNRFALIHLSSKRTKQLLQGAGVVLGEACDNKPVVTSLREIAEGKVRFMSQEEMDRLKELGLEEQVPGLEEAALQRAAAERAAKLAAAQEQAAAEKTLAEEPDADEETPSRNGNSENGHSHIKSASKDELAEIADDILKDDAVELLAGDDFPADDFTLGFSNVASNLSISSTHIDLYELAADALLAEISFGRIAPQTTVLAEAELADGVGVPFGTARNLWVAGDVVFTVGNPGDDAHPLHTYMFHGWKDRTNKIGWVIDNQAFTHERDIFNYGSHNFSPFKYALRSRE